MSNKEVDLSQIRGDWDFHARYVTNALEQTLKRQSKLWKELNKASKKQGQVPVTGQLVEDFIEACSQTRALTDDIYLLAATQASTSVVKKATKNPAKKKQSEKKAAKKSAAKTAKQKGARK